MSTTIEDRVILLLRDHVGEKAGSANGIRKFRQSDTFGGYGFWQTLERRTGISYQRWQKAYARRQRPTPDMIEALGKLLPEYAFWLVTGITDAINGHIAPRTAQTFPERVYPSSLESEDYFQAQISLADKLFKDAQVNIGDETERMYAIERTRPLSHWIDSPLLEVAHRIARSEEYANMALLWKAREEARQSRIDQLDHDTKSAVEGVSTDSGKGLASLGIHKRSQHQLLWELFYRPTDSQKTKFALSLLNIAPGELSDEEVDVVTKLTATEMFEYLMYHKMDVGTILMPTGGVHNQSAQLTASEVENFKRAVAKFRESKK